MVRYPVTVILFGLITVSSFIVSAQEQLSANKRIVGSKIDSSNSTSLSFDKSLNTYHWIGSLLYQNVFGPMYVQLHERFLSTLIRTDRTSITDDQMLSMRLRYRLSNYLSASSNVSSSLLSDNRSVGSSIGNASSHAWYLGFSYQPFQQLTVEPLVGARIDKQIDQRDHGPSYFLSVAADSINSAGYIGSMDGSFQYDDISPRILETHYATLTLRKQFFNQTSNFLGLNYYRNRRDFYLSADSAIKTQHNIWYNIESRADNFFAVSDTLLYTVNENMGWIMHGSILTREITHATRYKNIDDPTKSQLNTVINELKLEGSIRGMYRLSNSFRSSLAFSYLERDEKHRLEVPQLEGTSTFKRLENIEEQKNNHARRASLASTTDWGISSSDTVALSASINGLHYDTPSSGNNDDRDEVWYLVTLSTHHRLNQHLSLDVAADANLSHIVYLFASRSADNNWNRIIRLSPSLYYIPWQSFSTRNTFEVLANYTVYDFETASMSLRSYAFRQFAWIDSTNFILTRRLALKWFSHIRLYERGEFQWHTFAEKPVNYFEEKLYLGTIEYTLPPCLLFSVGIRYFSQKRFGYDGSERMLANYFRSIGPTTSIEMNIKNRTIFIIRGWYERQRQTAQPVTGSTTITATLTVQI